MSGRIDYTIALVAGVATGIAASQAVVGANNVVLNGSLVTGGVATLDVNGQARQVAIASAGIDTGITFTVTGYLYQGSTKLFSETIAGASIATAVTTNLFYQVTQIATSGSTAANITVGTNGVGASPWKPIDRKTVSFNAAIATILVTGSASWSIEWTYNDILNGESTPLPFADDVITNKNANTDAQRNRPAAGFRTKILSGTGTVRTIYMSGDRAGG